MTVSGETVSSAKVSWSAMVGASLTYEYKYDTAVGTTASTSKTLTGLTNDKVYNVKVRVATQLVDSFPWSSRWSTKVSFSTLETIGMPDNQVPGNGMQNAPLLPSFVWLTVGNAEYYELQLSTNPVYTEADGFVDPILEAVITAPTTAYTSTTELAYDTDHYWIVRAVSTDAKSGIDAYSTWCFSNFHTMQEPIEPPPPVTIPPQITPIVNLPPLTVIPPDIIIEIPDITVIPPDITVIPPEIIVEIPDIILPTPTTTIVQPQIEMPEEVTPVYIWIIVAIGAVLVTAVIILIIRTRRVV